MQKANEYCFTVTAERCSMLQQHDLYAKHQPAGGGSQTNCFEGCTEQQFYYHIWIIFEDLSILEAGFGVGNFLGP